MARPYIRASELKDFDYCRRAWFLQREGVSSDLVLARQLGSADQHRRATAVYHGKALHRFSHILFGVFWIALLALIGIWLLRR